MLKGVLKDMAVEIQNAFGRAIVISLRTHSPFDLLEREEAIVTLSG